MATESKVITELSFREEERSRFEAIKAGEKRIETRAGGKAEYESIQEGGVILFTCGDDFFEKKVIKVHHFNSLSELFTAIPLHEVLPEASSLDEAEEIYNSFPGYNERISNFGIFSFELEPI